VDSEKVVIISADGHAGPASVADYGAYLESKFQPQFQDYLAQIERYDARYRDNLTNGGAGAGEGDQGLWDFALRERHLDQDGVSAEVLHIQGSVPFGVYPAVAARDMPMDFEPTRDQLVAGCRAYNRWLADQCARDPRRYLGVARLPIPDIEASVAEVAFAAKAGLKGGVALPVLSRPDIPFYNDPRYEPLWAACEDHGMALTIHGSANLSYGNGPERLALILSETDWFGRRGVGHVLFSGVFERHPKLHLAITEQRTHWLEPMLREYDSIYDFWGNARLRQHLPRRPSEYFASNCFVGASFMSRLECEARGALGPVAFMWGSDYPHEEGVWPDTRASLRWTFGCGVPPQELRQMLGANAARCYGLDVAELQPIADRIGPAAAELCAPLGQLPERTAASDRMKSWGFREGGPWH
jgi:predicted TIM-barrel fold metal-dependent hydrolase